MRAYRSMLPGRSEPLPSAAAPRRERRQKPPAPQPKKPSAPAPAPAPAPQPAALPDGLGAEERRLVELVRQGAETPEELIARCGLPAPRVMSMVTMLEMDGVLRREKGRLVIGT